MNKLTSILALITYSSTLFGVTINFHYCAGKFSGLALSNFGGAVQCGCSTHDSTHRRCCSDRTIYTKTNNYKAFPQYWISPDFSDFKVLVYLLNMSVASPQPASSKSHYSSARFTRSHSTKYLTFICTYRI